MSEAAHTPYPTRFNAKGHYCLESVSQHPSGEMRCAIALVEERIIQSDDRMQMIVCVEPVSITNTRHRESYTQRIDEKPSTIFDLLLERDADGRWNARFATIEDVILIVELRGFGFALYAFSRLIAWGQHHAPNASVASLKLAYVDATTDQARDKRNLFYTRLGFDMIYVPDTQERAGRCVASSLSQLKSWHTNQITVTSTAKSLARLQQELSLEQRGRIHDRANAGNAYHAYIDRENQLRRRLWVFSSITVASVTICILIVSVWMTN